MIVVFFGSASLLTEEKATFQIQGYSLFPLVFWGRAVFSRCGGGCFSTTGQLFQRPEGGEDSYALICMCTCTHISTEGECNVILYPQANSTTSAWHIPILSFLRVTEITHCLFKRGCWLYYSNTVWTECGLAKVGFLIHGFTVTVTMKAAQRLARSWQTLPAVKLTIAVYVLQYGHAANTTFNTTGMFHFLLYHTKYFACTESMPYQSAWGNHVWIEFRTAYENEQNQFK